MKKEEGGGGGGGGGREEGEARRGEENWPSFWRAFRPAPCRPQSPPRTLRKEGREEGGKGRTKEQSNERTKEWRIDGS
jgi:hypothetical protein